MTVQCQYTKRQSNEDCKEEHKDIDGIYEQKMEKLNKLIQSIELAQEQDEDARFDYIFANAPDNAHNRSKLAAAQKNGNVVIDTNYQVDVKIASNAAIDVEANERTKEVCNWFSSNVVVLGGDACVPPNPMAAYGATLSASYADMLVQLAVSHGHLNAILSGLDSLKKAPGMDWSDDVKELKSLYTQYYNARGRSENYFQWMQTLICNLYSLPPTKQHQAWHSIFNLLSCCKSIHQ